MKNKNKRDEKATKPLPSPAPFKNISLRALVFFHSRVFQVHNLKMHFCKNEKLPTFFFSFLKTSREFANHISCVRGGTLLILTYVLIPAVPSVKLVRGRERLSSAYRCANLFGKDLLSLLILREVGTSFSGDSTSDHPLSSSSDDRESLR